MAGSHFSIYRPKYAVVFIGPVCCLRADIGLVAAGLLLDGLESRSVYGSVAYAVAAGVRLPPSVSFPLLPALAW